MKKYEPKKLVKISRYQNYFPTLSSDIQNDVYKRINELIEEEKQYCDDSNYKHMAQILTSIALYEVLQKHGKSEEEDLKDIFNKLDEISIKNSDKILSAFIENKVSYTDFADKCNMKLVEVRTFYKDALVLLKNKVNIITKISMKVAEKNKQVLILHLK